jgi:hypothetical protein
MTRVDFEEVQRLLERRREINRLNFSDIEWFKDGQRIEVPANVQEEFRFTGLANTDFVEIDFAEFTAPESVEK